jgi:hypothetical protein
MTAEWEAAHRKIQAEANAARSEAAKAQIAAQPRDEKGRVKPGSSTNSATTRPRSGHEKGARLAAELSGTNRGAVQWGAPC